MDREELDAIAEDVKRLCRRTDPTGENKDGIQESGWRHGTADIAAPKMLLTLVEQLVQARDRIVSLETRLADAEQRIRCVEWEVTK